MLEQAIQNSIKEILSARTVLLVCQSPLDGDSLGSALAMALTLNKLGKKTCVHCSAGLPKAYNFLPASEGVTPRFEGMGGDFIVSLDCSKTEIDRLKYKPEGDKINIIITPKNGSFSATDISFPKVTPEYDLVITLDCAALKMTGRFIEKRQELPQKTRVINIDHHATNEQFGDINLVDSTATATTEVVLRLIDALAEAEKMPDLLDPDIATCLITGIITDTGSFQNSNTGPSSFLVASRLLKIGARQQDVIKHLFKTKDLSALQLWGKILSRLHEEPDIRMVYSWVGAHDYEEVQADQDATTGLIDKLMTAVPNTRFAMLLRDVPNEKMVKGSLRSCREDVNVAEIGQLFGGGGHAMAAGFRIPDTTIGSVKEHVLETIRHHQRSLLKGELLKQQGVLADTGAIDIPAADNAGQNIKQDESLELKASLLETVRQNTELKDLPENHPLRKLDGKQDFRKADAADDGDAILNLTPNDFD